MKNCSTIRRPDLRSLTLLLLILPDLLAVEVRIASTAGLQLMGDVIQADESELTLAERGPLPRREVTLPTASIREFALMDPQVVLQNPQHVLPLEPLFEWAEPKTLELLRKVAETLAEQQKWELCHAWMNAIDSLRFEADAQIQNGILKAKCLRRLHLRSALREQLKHLNNKVSPIAAPLELCFLNAQIALEDEDWATAVFWARLPNLRLPNEQDPRLRILLDQVPDNWNHLPISPSSTQQIRSP